MFAMNHVTWTQPTQWVYITIRRRVRNYWQDCLQATVSVQVNCGDFRPSIVGDGRPLHAKFHHYVGAGMWHKSIGDAEFAGMEKAGVKILEEEKVRKAKQ